MYADAYKSALDFLNTKPPGYITFVSHVGRDLMNELAVTVQEMQSAQAEADPHISAKRAEGGRVDYPKLTNELQQVWKDEWGSCRMDVDRFQPNLGEMPEKSEKLESGHFMPLETCEKIQELIDAHKAGHERDLDKGILFFTRFWGYVHKEDIPTDVFKDWEDAKKWFGAHNHLRKGSFSKAKSCEVQRHFRILDELLYIAASSAYARIKEINETLEETNQ